MAAVDVKDPLARPARRKRIYARLRGQLGNHMLQYAAARALAEHMSADLTLVTTLHGDDGGLTTYLAPFGTTGFDLAPPDVPQNRTAKRWRRIKEKWLTSNARRMGLPVVWDHRLRSVDDFFAISEPCYLTGYWQSPAFFAPIADRIRAEFDLGRFDGPRLRAIRSLIEAQPTVAVHVRLGDFIDMAARYDWFDYCRRDYFDRARGLLDRWPPKKRYLVFSDDPAAARTLLEGWPDCRFVEGNAPLEDMFLISRCPYIVIANSTFSWWAAWLRNHPDGIVIAPRLWLATLDRGAVVLPDPFPADWIVL